MTRRPREEITLTGKVIAIHNEDPIAVVEVPFTFTEHEIVFIKNGGYRIGELITFGVDDVVEDPRSIDRGAAAGNQIKMAANGSYVP